MVVPDNPISVCNDSNSGARELDLRVLTESISSSELGSAIRPGNGR